MSGSRLHLVKLRPEAEVRAAHAVRTATPGRIEPTFEDREITRRTVRRLMRWTQEENAKGERRVTAVDLCAITRRAVEDALHFSPEDLAGAGGIR